MLLGTVGVLLAAQATVVGVVRDGQTSQPLASAVVEFTDLDRAAATGADGRYTMPHVPAGPQHVSIRAMGYSRRWLHALVPRHGELELNISLPPEPIPLQAIEVRAPVPVRGLEGGEGPAFPARELLLAAVRNHPLLEEADHFQALAGGDVFLQPESPSGVHIRGGASDQTAYLLDGVPVFSPFHAAGLSSAWNPDALSRLSLSSIGSSPGHPHTLSGTIEGVTRVPGDRLRAQGSFSTTQARLTLDGPLGPAGAGYVVGLRSGLPGAFAPKGEASYVRGEIGDWLAKLEMPIFRGRVRLLGYDSENEVEAAAAIATEDVPSPTTVANLFAWHSRSLGAEWNRSFSGTTVRVRGWSARSDAGSIWAGRAEPVEMTALRRDLGLLASAEYGSARTLTVAGIRLEESRTSYGIESDSLVPSWTWSASTPVATLFAQHARGIGPGVQLDLEASIAATAGHLYPGPRAQLRWNLSEHLTLHTGYARTHQFVQSLRNAESVVGNVFPVELYMGAGASAVPVAQGDQVVVAADYRPSSGVRVGLQAFERSSTGLVLVAPRDGQPFLTSGFVVGSGAARGLSVEAAWSATRWGILASYGLQHVRLDYGDSSYVPDHGAAHLLEGGIIVFPSATASIRLGVAAALGRRTTTAVGGFEWESYNLLDRGAEFGGSPQYEGAALGATPLPAYVRVDLGLRKHWHIRVAGRDASIALFGTATNLLGRTNILTYARNPSTGELVGIEMRPRAPLVVGLDWQF